MKRRCKDSVFLKKINLTNFKLVNNGNAQATLSKRAPNASTGVFEVQIMSTEEQKPVQSKGCDVAWPFAQQRKIRHVDHEHLTCEEVQQQR